MTTRILGITFSILLHLLVLFLVLIPVKQPPPTGKPAATSMDDEYYPLTVRLIPMEKPSEDPEVLKGNKDALIYPADGKICDGKDNKYRGIGILHSFGSHVIIHAPEFYPAYKAGLRTGDYILNTDFKEINGYIDVMVMRGNDRLSFHVKVDKICYTME